MSETKLKGAPISPTKSLQISPPHIPPPLRIPLPGTTDDQPYRTLPGKWRTRLRERLGRLEVGKAITPYLVRAEERADAAIGEIEQTTGACGPIAETQVALGARFAELALYYLDRADPETREGRSDILLARACADTSRLNLSDALKTSAAIAAMKPPSTTDPLAAYLTAEEVAAPPLELDPSDDKIGLGS